MKKLLLVLSACAFLGACATAPKTARQLNDEFTGTFAGTLPCADCSGVDTQLALNPDGTYVLSETYHKGAPQNFTSAGKWTADKDLKYVALGDSKNYYAFHGKDELKKLDATAQPIKSGLNYTLKRQTPDFAAVTGKTWKLSQVKSAPGEIIFDASKQDQQFFKDAYTITFDNGRASGKAAPNRFNAPYNLGEGNAISFLPAAATLMMGIKEPVGLNEHGFFVLLEKVNKWNISNNQLTLYTVNGLSEKVTMTFNEFN